MNKTDDLISREDAIDALQKEINKGIPPFDDTMGAIRCGVRLARNIIEDLPSAQPKRGEWIELGQNKDGTHNIGCSLCGFAFKSRCHANSYNARKKYKFCGGCGARMSERSE